ncbi:restriction endonuclease subunit S [Adhaeribacter rhizoryzae]|uniref:Restriction endonuclease subunit S n=1 Tax=Adhaeribacter rhizoryzae TaxID=2607907 RepID=A0A5M6D3J3_9BACT|nr:restriction endonuclease subunit S [Adhaeribacter rhizoryzae]KAA5542061.1 restriction endonuclease subunit S [Adhaeribacter rhizoryzae]
MTILDFFKTAHPSVLAAKMIFKYLQEHYPVYKISDIADTSSGGTPNRGMIEYYNGEIPWVKSGELKDALITSCGEYITESGLKNSSAKLFPKGTLLVAMYGANIGKTGVLNFDATTNQAVCAIFPKVEISKEFLFWYFKQQRIDFIAIGKGGAQPNISQTVINNASIVVPDKKSQQAIVNFLDNIEKGNGIDEKFFLHEVLNDVERIYKYKNNYVDLVDSFRNQLAQIKNLNQAILQEAVQGNLVEQNTKDEPASELLKRIKAEKAKSGKKEKKLPLIKPEEIPFKIPKNWLWCKGEAIANYIDPQPSHRTPPVSLDGVPYIAMSDINKNGVINFVSARKVSYAVLEEHRNRYQLQKGDFIFGKIGTIGKPVKLPEPYNYTLSANVILIQPDRNIIDDNYLFYFLCSPIAEKNLRDKKSTTSYPVFGMGKARDMLIPLPPISEQKRIVAEIEKQLAKTQQLKNHILANQQATEQLLKALLHQAFAVEEVLVEDLEVV